MDNTGKVVLVGGALIAALLWASKAGATSQFVCPIDGLEFASQAELTAHMAAEHPGVRIPINITWS